MGLIFLEDRVEVEVFDVRFYEMVKVVFIAENFVVDVADEGLASGLVVQ